MPTGVVATIHGLLVDSPLTALAYIIAATIAYLAISFTATAIYNVFFHPLRDLPGPKLAAITGLYKDYILLAGTLPYWEQQLHETYGPTVRVSPNEVHFIDAQAWRDIYGHRTGGKPATVKPKGIQPAVEGHDMLEFIDSEEEHGQRRRLYAHAFSDRAIQAQEPMLHHHVGKFIEKLRSNAAKEPGKPQDIVSWLHFVTFDIMGDLAFGNDMGMLDDGKYNPWVRAIVSSMKVFALVGTAKKYPILRFLINWTPLGPAIQKGIAAHRSFAAERVDKRLEKDVDRPDIWGLVLKADPDRLPSRWAMHEDGMLFMQGGTDTSSTLLAGLLYHLLLNPDKLALLQNEIRTELKDPASMTLSNLARLPYMAACIEEGLRIHPPAPPGMSRDAPPGGIAVCGRFFADGTRLAVPQWAAYHSTHNFTSPHSFHPERWYTPPGSTPDPRFAHDRKDVLQPFLYGPRNCIGKNLAYSEMRLILASVIRTFDLELAEQSLRWMPHAAFGLWQKPALWVRFVEREG